MHFILKALQNLGLSEKQARAYVALLQLGRATSYAVAEKSGLKKPTTYVILEELIEKGVAQLIPRAKKRLYIAIEPEKFLQHTSETFIAAQKVLPELQLLAKAGDGQRDKARALYYEGLHGIRQSLSYSQTSEHNKSIYGFYAADVKMSKEGEEIVLEWAIKNEKNNIEVRGVVPRSETVQKYIDPKAKIFKKVKTVDKAEYSSTISIEAAESFIRIVDLNQDILEAVIIDNPRIAKAMREVFQLVWKNI